MDVLDYPVQPAPLADRQTLLMVYDDVLARSKNARRLFHQPIKNHANPILSPDRDYEDVRIQVWGNIVTHQGGYRQFAVTYGQRHEQYLVALDSADGLTWYRPNLGLHEVDGNKDNNILIPTDAQGSVFMQGALILNPKPTSEKDRYLFFAWKWAKKMEGKGHDATRSGLMVFHSPDGLQMTCVTPQPILTHGLFGPHTANDVISVYYDKQAGCFTRYTAALLPAIGTSKVAWDNMPSAQRVLAQAHSSDGLEWSKQQLMLTADRNEPAWQQYYGVTVSPYEGIWVGFPLYYHVVEQFMAGHVTYSKDRQTWDRPTRQPFLPVGDSADSWDYGFIMLSWDFIVKEDEIIFVYSGSPHREHTRRASMAMGTATLRRDGFCSLAAGGAKPGLCELTTIASSAAPGRHVLLNIGPDWHENPHFQAQVEDENFQPIPGYTFNDFPPQSGDAVRLPLQWKTVDRLPTDKGPLRLALRMNNQRLYAIRFA